MGLAQHTPSADPSIPTTIRLNSGRYYDLANPEASFISIQDIAVALSNICRFTGHTTRFYSVAEHSVHVSELVPEEDAFAALMHDAVESVVGDMSKPLKALLPEYKAIEKRCEAAILKSFGLPSEMPESVKRADIVMLAIEQRQAMRAEQDHWPGITGADSGVERELLFLPPDVARRYFIGRFMEVRRG